MTKPRQHERREMEIFFLGALLGVLFGGTLCAAYIRQEITARISPKLRHVELQLETVEAQLNLAVMTRYAELAGQPVDSLPRPSPNRDDR
jgi:hypothetical protein